MWEGAARVPPSPPPASSSLCRLCPLRCSRGCRKLALSPRQATVRPPSPASQLLVLKVNPHSVAGSQPLPRQPFPPQLIKSARLLSEEKRGCLLRLQNVKGAHGLKTCWQGIARAYVYEAGAARPLPPRRPAAAAALAAANCLPDRHLLDRASCTRGALAPSPLYGKICSAHRDSFTKRN